MKKTRYLSYTISWPFKGRFHANINHGLFFQIKLRHILLINPKSRSSEVFIFVCGTHYAQHHLVETCGNSGRWINLDVLNIHNFFLIFLMLVNFFRSYFLVHHWVQEIYCVLLQCLTFPFCMLPLKYYSFFSENIYVSHITFFWRSSTVTFWLCFKLPLIYLYWTHLSHQCFLNI